MDVMRLIRKLFLYSVMVFFLNIRVKFIVLTQDWDVITHNKNKKLVRIA